MSHIWNVSDDECFQNVQHNFVEIITAFALLVWNVNENMGFLNFASQFC